MMTKQFMTTFDCGVSINNMIYDALSMIYVFMLYSYFYHLVFYYNISRSTHIWISATINGGII